MIKIAIGICLLLPLVMSACSWIFYSLGSYWGEEIIQSIMRVALAILGLYLIFG